MDFADTKKKRKTKRTISAHEFKILTAALNHVRGVVGAPELLALKLCHFGLLNQSEKTHLNHIHLYNLTEKGRKIVSRFARIKEIGKQ